MSRLRRPDITAREVFGVFTRCSHFSHPHAVSPFMNHVKTNHYKTVPLLFMRTTKRNLIQASKTFEYTTGTHASQPYGAFHHSRYRQ